MFQGIHITQPFDFLYLFSLSVYNKITDSVFAGRNIIPASISPGPQGTADSQSTTGNSNQTDDQSAEQQERTTLEREIEELYSRHRAMRNDNPKRETLAEELRTKNKKLADMDFERILRENSGMKVG